MWALCHCTGLSRPMQFLHANATWNVTRAICRSVCRKTGWYFGHVNEFYLVARENIWTSLKSTIQMFGQTFATCLFRSHICWCNRFTWLYFICGYAKKLRYIYVTWFCQMINTAKERSRASRFRSNSSVKTHVPIFIKICW